MSHLDESTPCIAITSKDIPNNDKYWLQKIQLDLQADVQDKPSEYTWEQYHEILTMQKYLPWLFVVAMGCKEDLSDFPDALMDPLIDFDELDYDDSETAKVILMINDAQFDEIFELEEGSAEYSIMHRAYGKYELQAKSKALSLMDTVFCKSNRVILKIKISRTFNELIMASEHEHMTFNDFITNLRSIDHLKHRETIFPDSIFVEFVKYDAGIPVFAVTL